MTPESTRRWRSRHTASVATSNTLDVGGLSRRTLFDSAIARRTLWCLILALFTTLGAEAVLAVTPTQVAKLLAGDGASGDLFGSAVAVSGNTAVIGAPQDDGSGSDSGSAYVFVRVAGTWIQEGKLTAGDAAAADQFGFSVSVSGDTAVIGAHFDDDAGSNSGAAYVFVRSGGVWIEQAKLAPGDAAASDEFGISVAVNGDTAVIGASFDNHAEWGAGSAYVFVRNGTSWSQQAKLTANDAFQSDGLGNAVALDGDTAIVGANHKAVVGWSDEAGAAYIFVRNAGLWTQQAKLTASDAAAQDAFGTSVAVSGDAAIVGSGGNDDSGSGSGSAYVFARTGTAWAQQAKLTASDAAPADLFGTSVAIDGNTAIASSPGDDDNSVSDSGSVYLFESDGGVWTQQVKLTASDSMVAGRLGSSVAVSGNTHLIGQRHDDDHGGSSGSAYLFEAPAIDPDVDDDGVPDDTDNCVSTANPDQTDTDLDGQGDACDLDDDGDGVADASDNCHFTPNPDQADLDADGLGNVCDTDPDGDGVTGAADNCPLVPNADQTDTDGDSAGDDCDADDDNDTVCDIDASAPGCSAGPDNCPTIFNIDQQDLESDGIGDACDADLDGDSVSNENDNCPVDGNVDQNDVDGDGAGDVCDADIDDDGVANAGDNCPNLANADQSDLDGDGQGDACDADVDGDGIATSADNCPLVANSDQSDFDGDGSGDACDPDVDGDGVANGGDSCGLTAVGEVVDPQHGCSVAQLCPCAGPAGTTTPWKNHGKYVSCVAHVAGDFAAAGLITQAQKDATVSAAGQSACGQ